MKWNWGKSIVVAFALFIIFIMYFVLKVQMKSEYDHELVTEDYYKKEREFEGKYHERQNAQNLSQKITIATNDQGIVIEFPKDFDYKNITGKVSLYRPSNQKLDFDIPISLTSSILLIPKTKLAGGLWDISVECKHKGIGYLVNEKVNL